MSSSIKKNFLYNAFYQVLTIILPLITAPYISRVMGAERVGIYSYSYSIASYFGLFILLGLGNYGNRTISGVKDDSEKLSRTFCSIYAIQIIMSVIVIIIYIGYVLLLASDKMMAWIQLIYIISVVFDINWFFFGMELFKITVIRNTIIKLVNVVCILTFVKSADDIYLYGLIIVIGTLISQLMLWNFLRRYVYFTRVSLSEVKAHIIPNLTLFIPVIAVSLYTVMDKIMLGAMSTMKEVGYYESSNKLTTIPTMAVTALGTVMLPRMSNLIAKGKHNKAKKYIQKSLIFSAMLSSSMAFGLSAISKEFVPIFYGKGFEKCVIIISILVVSCIFISWANVIRTQYLIPNKQDKIYIISVFLGAIVNTTINIILIPHLQAIGAAIGTLFAELTVCIYQTYMVRKEIKVGHYFKQSLPLLLNGIIMYIVVANIPLISNNIITLIIKVLVGGIVYIILASGYYLLVLKKIFNNSKEEY